MNQKKRLITEHFQVQVPETQPRKPEIPDDVRFMLSRVGANARKRVSEGHLTRSLSLPSYCGETCGPTDTATIREQQATMDRAHASKSFSTGDACHATLKRSWDCDGDDDDGTDVDEPAAEARTNAAGPMGVRKYFVPRGYRPPLMGPAGEDFEDAGFLMSKDSFS